MRTRFLTSVLVVLDGFTLDASCDVLRQPSGYSMSPVITEHVSKWLEVINYFSQTNYIAISIRLIFKFRCCALNVQIVQLLLRHGADVTLKNNEGHTAFEMTSAQIREMLLDSADQGGIHSCLCQAAWQGNIKLVKKFLVRNKNTNCMQIELYACFRFNLYIHVYIHNTKISTVIFKASLI